jgi:hypothetical protein
MADVSELRKIVLVFHEKKGRPFNCGESKCTVTIDALTLERRGSLEEYFQELKDDLINMIGDGALQIRVLADKSEDEEGDSEDTVSMTTFLKDVLGLVRDKSYQKVEKIGRGYLKRTGDTSCKLTAYVLWNGHTPGLKGSNNVIQPSEEPAPKRSNSGSKTAPDAVHRAINKAVDEYAFFEPKENTEQKILQWFAPNHSKGGPVLQASEEIMIGMTMMDVAVGLEVVGPKLKPVMMKYMDPKEIRGLLTHKLGNHNTDLRSQKAGNKARAVRRASVAYDRRWKKPLEGLMWKDRLEQDRLPFVERVARYLRSGDVMVSFLTALYAGTYHA